LKFHLGQSVRIWDRNKGEIVGLPPDKKIGTEDVYEVEWEGFHGTLSASFKESELSEEK
jgi:hypothetical protein